MISTLTLNVHKGVTALTRVSMLETLRTAVQAVNSDLVFLQEIVGADTSPPAANKLMNGQSQYEYLADTIWSDYAYGKNAVYESGHHGNAILSRYPIKDSRNHDISHDGDESRGLLHAVVERPAPLHAICVHLGLKEKHRRLQSAALCDFIDREIPAHEPLIVAGDFNDWRLSSHHLLSTRAHLTEVFSAVAGRPARTFPARLPVLPLDRIYVRAARTLSATVLSSAPWSKLSDHAGLLTRLELSA